MARPLTTEPPAPLANFEDLYREFAGQVFAWARRYAGGRTGWAEDVTHDVFLRAWLHRDELRAGDVKSWLYRVTQNRAFTLLRREGTIAGQLRRAVHLAWHGEAPATPEDALAERRASASATVALQALPGQERVVLALKILDGLSQREIAALLSLSEGYVSKLVARATARLGAKGWKVGGSDG